MAIPGGPPHAQPEHELKVSRLNRYRQLPFQRPFTHILLLRESNKLYLPSRLEKIPSRFSFILLRMTKSKIALKSRISINTNISRHKDHVDDTEHFAIRAD